MEHMRGCCGINCETCDARIATINNDDALRAKTAELWCKLNNTDQIKPEHINCLGCKQDGLKSPFCEYMCSVRKCCMQNGWLTCYDCPDKEECELLRPIIENNADAKTAIIETSDSIVYV